MRILITGVLGFIGSHLTRYMISNGHEVIGISNKYSNLTTNRIIDIAYSSCFNLKIQDLSTNFSELSKNVDIVIHLAAKTRVDYSLLKPTEFINNNIISTNNLLEDIRHNGNKLVILVSSYEVYGPIETGNNRENSLLLPNNPYSVSKASGDLLGLSYWEDYKTPVIILRLSSIYGNWMQPYKAIPTFVREALKGNPLPVYGDGHHKRNWLAVEDVCTAIELLMNQGKPGEIYHASSSEEIENLTLAEDILKIMNINDGRIRFLENWDNRPGHARRYSIDSSKLISMGWTPQREYSSYLPTLVDWCKNHPLWINS